MSRGWVTSCAPAALTSRASCPSVRPLRSRTPPTHRLSPRASRLRYSAGSWRQSGRAWRASVTAALSPGLVVARWLGAGVGDLLAGRAHGVPLSAESVQALALGVAWGAVAGEVVERVTVERHLHLAVAAANGLQC